MASDYLLELDGVKGESQEAKHPGAIHIESFSWGVSNPSSIGGGGGGAGKSTFQDFNFAKQEDSTSPVLMLHCAKGEHIKKAVLTVRKAGEKPLEYLKIELENVLVSSFAQAGGGGEVPTDQFSLAFAKITYSHFSQNADGNVGAPVIATWDLKTAKGS